MDFTTNNCGMYWSDGKIQKSVSKFSTKPVNELDWTCQEHDRAYKLAKEQNDLTVADNKFYESNKGKGPRRTLYAHLVRDGNFIIRNMDMLDVDGLPGVLWLDKDPGGNTGGVQLPTSEAFDYFPPSSSDFSDPNLRGSNPKGPVTEYSDTPYRVDVSPNGTTTYDPIPTEPSGPTLKNPSLRGGAVGTSNKGLASKVYDPYTDSPDNVLQENTSYYLPSGMYLHIARDIPFSGYHKRNKYRKHR